MFSNTFGELPELIRKENYLLDTPIKIESMIYSRQESSVFDLSLLHEHPFIEISYVEKGTGIHTIWRESYPIHPGDVFILNSSVPHGLFSVSDTDPLTVRSLYFDPADLFSDEIVEIGNPQYIYGLFSSNNFVVSLPLKSKSLRNLSQNFDEISLEIEKHKLDWEQVVSFQLALLLLQIKRLAADSAPQFYTCHPSSMENTVLTAEVLHLIKTHYAEPLFSMKSISEILHVSTSSLSRSFHDVTGKYFSDYLCLYRIRQALSMISETEISIEEIASLCGYNDMHSFYRQFKQVMGITPKELRKQNPEHPIQIYQTNKELNHILYTEIIENLQCGKRKEIRSLILQALDEGFSPDEILQEGLVKGMNALGEKFQTNKAFLADVLAAANIMDNCMEILRPYFPATSTSFQYCAVICTVRGDMHSIGKNLVKLMLETTGIRCIDLGEDVSPQEVVDAVREHHAGLVCLSALLTSTMIAQKDTIDALVDAGLRKRVKVMVGGAPVTQEFADRIGADAYTPDAITAAQAAKRLLAELETK